MRQSADFALRGALGQARRGGPADNIRGGGVRSFFEGCLASSGHRGRDDARGRCCHAPSDLTRTSRRDAGASCLDGQGDVTLPTRSSCAQSQDPCLANVVAAVDSATARATTRWCRSCVTTPSAGSSSRDSRQARRPAGVPAAGIVAASMARRWQNPSKKTADSSPANVVCRPAMRGTARRGSLFCEVKEEEAAGRRGTRTKQAPPVSRA